MQQVRWYEICQEMEEYVVGTKGVFGLLFDDIAVAVTIAAADAVALPPNHSLAPTTATSTATNATTNTATDATNESTTLTTACPTPVTT